jgi:ABC-type polysaccharide/polyol phosphate transport system ATPase subunit
VALPTLPDGRIEAEHLWKRFRPDTAGSVLRYEMDKVKSRLFGTPVAWNWALRDVNLLIEPGMSVGLVGDNGSGKSTLLKVLNRVMYPYAGRAEVGGRIGALIEVRAGIQPELSGRENIYLYGALLGLPRAEVTRRFDEIVEWSQLAFAIDRQVKFFSSGMQMRLGFGVAVFMEPAVLLVDEVLAVGDAQFQQRCLDRLRTATEAGTTLVFVSHDLAAVGAACSRVIWLQRGEVAADGTAAEVLAAYRRSVEQKAHTELARSGPVRLQRAEAINPNAAAAVTQDPLEVTVVVESDFVGHASCYLGVSEGTSDPIFVVRHYVEFTADVFEIRCEVQRLPLPRGRFFVWFGVIDHKVHPNADLMIWQPILTFDVSGPGLDDPPEAVVRRSPVHVAYAWDSSRVSHPGHDDGVALDNPLPRPS